jgi:hypothetical protein
MASGMTKVQFFDASGPDDQPLKAKKVSESSKLENSKAFAGAMAADGWLDTWWAEGADGDGSGEWLKFDFDGTKKLSRGAISMGLDQTESFFKGNNRATKATLTFSDGSTKDITLQDAMGLQEFDLGGVSTSSVQVTFGGIVKGETANDLYVGEVRFWE